MGDRRANARGVKDPWSFRSWQSMLIHPLLWTLALPVAEEEAYFSQARVNNERRCDLGVSSGSGSQRGSVAQQLRRMRLKHSE